MGNMLAFAVQQSRLLLVGVDAGKAKHDACTTQCHFFKNENVIEWLLIY
jgi:hypothetical protein